jgi:hypothetical protein
MVDAQGGRSSLIVLAGNHWKTRIVENHLLGGGEAMRIGADATECPGPWGWSRTPMFDLLVASNLCEEARSGFGINVSGDSHAKTIAGRTYLTGFLQDNTVRWSKEFLESMGSVAASHPRAYLIGASSGPDAQQMRLRLSGNKLAAPPGFEGGQPISATNALLEVE